MDLTPIDINESWPKVEKKLLEIMNQQGEGMGNTDWMDLYTMVYGLCLRGSIKGSKKDPKKRISVEQAGKIIYTKLEHFLQIQVKQLFLSCQGKIDEQLLRIVSKNWGSFVFSARIISFLFSFLDRHLVGRQDQTNQNNKPLEIFSLHMKIFKNEFYQPLKKKIIFSVLELIQNQREGENADLLLLKQTTDMFVTLGYTIDRKNGNLEIYNQDFEIPFFEQTDQYYFLERDQLMRISNVSEFMEKAEKKVNNEISQIAPYLHSKTEKELSQKCVKILIFESLELLWTGFAKLMNTNQTSDLQRMFNLLSRLQNGLQPLVKPFKKIIYDNGIEKLEQVRETAKENPKIYIETILIIYKKYLGIVKESFNNHHLFRSALTSSCTELLKKNPVLDLADSSSTLSLQIIAQFCNQLLKKTEMESTKNDLNQDFENIMMFINLIKKKTIFFEFYTKNLAERLLTQTSISKDSELTMFNKLESLIPHNTHAKIRNIFSQIEESKQISSKFQKYLISSKKMLQFNFDVRILPMRLWPFSLPKIDFTLPKTIKNCLTDFETFYCSDVKRSSRKLHWNLELSQIEVLATINNRSYLLITSPYQLGVLLMFQNRIIYKFEEIQDHLNLPTNLLCDILETLIQCKILISKGKIHENGNRYKLNYYYNNKLPRVQLNIKTNKKKQESEKLIQQIEEGRKISLQKHILRIFKSRKSLTHDKLIELISEHYTKSYRPSTRIIKKCISLCIDYNFIERSEHETNTYVLID
ncbi:cullin-1 [Anaeramoeba flamelloides]|uniref:Cullin-1 n=1 Tax=Anaeramoeba flamelloides TaxID=1746091 RepID=A0ABQ8X5X6_9EUKA|nr:cullin-1 [Anaeramoeba flamelloides]